MDDSEWAALNLRPFRPARVECEDDVVNPMARKYPVRQQWVEGIFQMYFGTEGTWRQRAISRAYLDFARTAHGIGGMPDADAMRDRAHERIDASLDTARVARSREEFDAWHRATRLGLIEAYRRENFGLSHGQAQKWINMSIKYVFALGPERIEEYSDFEAIYDYCHAPLDGVIFAAWASKVSTPASAWSKLDSDAYEHYLSQARRAFTRPLLTEEFYSWKPRAKTRRPSKAKPTA